MGDKRSVIYDSDLKLEAYRFQGVMQDFPIHFHDYYVIGLIEQGRRNMSCKSVPYLLEAGDLILFSPGDNHSCAHLEGQALDYRCLNIPKETMQNVVEEITGSPYLPQFQSPVLRHAEIEELLHDLHHQVLSESPEFEKEELFLSLIALLLQEYEQKPENVPLKHDSEQIQLICEYLENQYRQPITLDMLGALCNRSKYQLLRAFTRRMGITPYRYLETIRIGKAKALLEQGAQPIDAALETGFHDQSHFTNRFKKMIGLTPKQYRNIFEGTV